MRGDDPMGRLGDTPAETLDLVLERIVFHNPENGWTVARVRLEDGEQPATVVGRLLGVGPGQRLRVSGRWVVDRKYGRQFGIDSYQTMTPESLPGLEKYLGSGLLPGVGKVTAARIVERFGEETLRILDDEPRRLLEVPGIGKVTAAKIEKAWKRQAEVRDAMIFLQSHEISPRFATRVVKRFGAATTEVVRANPYRLAEDIAGLGFRSADRVARSLGWGEQAPERIGSGALYALRRAAEAGHLYLPWASLETSTAELLAIPLAVVAEVLPGLTERRAIIVEAEGDERRAYLPELWAAELGIAEHLNRLLAHRSTAPPLAVDRAIAWFEERSRLRFATEQRRAVARALEDKALILTGGPGTGKTTLVRAIVDILVRKGQRVLLAAPTGRAANRLSEACSREVKTIHRLLEVDPRSGEFRRNAARRLEADLVIVDEASMIDAPLAHALLAALADETRLLVVGDADQLPSVGPGRVLSDLIDSARLPVIRLEEIFRQAEESAIIRNAHRIHRGLKPDLEPSEASDFFFIRRRQPEEILDTLFEVVGRRAPSSFGLKPLRDIQVLAPMRRGSLGTEALNGALRDLLNPGSRGERGADRFRVDDRVMQTRNNYALDVFNGDIGFVTGSDGEERWLEVAYDRRRVRYQAADLEDLTLAYACTVHKAQGSEYPCVVLLLHGQHYVMLQRNLLYTAVTRAQRLLIIIGDPSSLEIALANSRQSERYSAVAERLRAHSRPSP
jgi:exodeoxyribonuclease V alpha subunit